MTQSFLQLNRISRSFDGVQALKDITLVIEEGKTYCLIGENGSGKSTLIKVIAGVLSPDSGEIVLHDRVYKRLRPIDAIQEGIQVIYQDFALLPNLTVAENIALNQEILRRRFWVNWREVKETAALALKNIQVNLDLHAKVADLPVVERQLIAVARALLQNARLIIMDEPTAALTQREIGSLLDAVENLKARGVSILFVSHKLDEALRIADRTMILRNGEKVADCEAAGLDRAAMAKIMTGKDLNLKRADLSPVPPESPVVLKVERLSCSDHFSEVSFELRAGEILGITGLLGSGRTDVALSLFGMLPTDSGTVTIAGKSVKLNSVQDALRCGIGYVPEDRLNEGLFLTQSVGNNIVVSIIDALVGKAGLLDHQAMSVRVSEWINRVQIKTDSTDGPVGSLSGGNQQRVVLAKWMAGNPRILILNSPTVGVDVGSKAELHNIICDLAKRGTALLVISDDLPELIQVCHRILVMKRGRIMEEVERYKTDETRLNTMLVSV